MKNRIFKIIAEEGLDSSLFADKLELPYSTIERILSGRNRPPLDVVMKILKKYPNINPDWLISGIGPMKKGDSIDIEISKALSINDINTTTNNTKDTKEGKGIIFIIIGMAIAVLGILTAIAIYENHRPFVYIFGSSALLLLLTGILCVPSIDFYKDTLQKFRIVLSNNHEWLLKALIICMVCIGVALLVFVIVDFIKTLLKYNLL